MPSAVAATRGLIDALEDSRLFCTRASAHVIHPPLRHLLAWIARTHQRIGDELRVRIPAGGRRVARTGRGWRALRLAWLGWQARSSFDVELAYANQARQREARLGQRFRDVLEQVEDESTRACLAQGLRDIERVRAQIEQLVAAMDVQGSAAGDHEGARAPVPIIAGRSPVPLRNDQSTGEKHHGRQP